MVYKVIPTPEFVRFIEKLKNKEHLRRIEKAIKKIEEKGTNTLEFLERHNEYILTEYKSKNPPYRLYVVKNQKKDEFILFAWTSKGKQEKTIKEIIKQMKLGIDVGVDAVFDLFG